MTVAPTPIVMSPSVLSGSLEHDLRSDQAQIATFQTQVGTGRAVSLPSDDPAQAADILQLGSAVSRAKQYSDNAQDGVSRLSLANSTVNSAMGVLQQVASTLEGLTGDQTTGNPATVAGVSTVVQSARSELIDLANTLYAGQAIFSGTGTPQRAYTQTGAYVGAGTAPTRTVAPGTHVAVSVTGPTVFGPTGPTGLLGKTGILAEIASDLGAGTSASISKAATTGLSALQAAMSNVEVQAGKLGADQQAIQGFAEQASATVTSFEKELASAQDVTMAQAITNLQAQQTSYQAALYIASQLNADSLVTYL
jgi:flagellar hook-associated protein 3 FlgL